MKLFLKISILIPLICLLSCKRDSGQDLLNAKDERLYISNEFLTEDGNEASNSKSVALQEVEQPKRKISNSAPVSLNAGGSSNFRNYRRSDDSPQEFAKAAVWHAVRMVYKDDFTIRNIQVLNTQENGNQLVLDLSVAWTDRWVNIPYLIKGTLKVNKDGSNGQFNITSKNLEAEALELTNEQTVSILTLPNI